MSRIATNLQANLQAVSALVAEVSRQVGGQVQLLAVSKAQPPEIIRETYAAGQRAFAENYLQEALAKMAQLTDLSVEWHFIGPIQSNKTKLIAEYFAWVHSVDREKIARRLSEGRPAGMAALNVCIQVNISGEDTKSGVAPEEAEGLCRLIAGLPNLRLRGLMTIGQPGLDEAGQREQFRAMKTLFKRINASGLQMDTLSMGMSEDLRAAILEGSTMVRVGTAIFGRRPGQQQKEVA